MKIEDKIELLKNKPYHPMLPKTGCGFCNWFNLYKELKAEVEKLQAWKKLVSDIVQQHDDSHLRKMLKELTK